MCRARKIYLSYFLILNTADLILGFLCGLLPGHAGHGIGYYEAKSAAAQCKDPTGLVPTSEGYRCAFSPSAAEVAEPAQASSFKGPHSVEIHSSCDDFQTPILALFQLPCGDERVIPTLLEIGQEWVTCNDTAFVPPEYRQQQSYNPHVDLDSSLHGMVNSGRARTLDH